MSCYPVVGTQEDNGISSWVTDPSGFPRPRLPEEYLYWSRKSDKISETNIGKQLSQLSSPLQKFINILDNQLFSEQEREIIITNLTSYAQTIDFLQAAQNKNVRLIEKNTNLLVSQESYPKQLDLLQKTIDDLKEQLMKYGDHLDDCILYDNISIGRRITKECNCNWEQKKQRLLELKVDIKKQE